MLHYRKHNKMATEDAMNYNYALKGHGNNRKGLILYYRTAISIAVTHI